MANARYSYGTSQLAKKLYDLTAGSLKAYLLGTGYTFSDAHQHLSDLTLGSNQIGSAVVLSSVTVTPTTGAGAVVNCGSPIVFTSVPAVGQIKSIVFAIDDGVSAATSPLFVYIDTATNLPLTPNGGNINFTVDTGTSKLYAI